MGTLSGNVHFQGMYTFRECTLSGNVHFQGTVNGYSFSECNLAIFYLLFQKGSFSKGKLMLPEETSIGKDFIHQGRKHEIMKDVPLCKNDQ